MERNIEKIEIGMAIVSAIVLGLYALPYLVAIIATVLYYLGVLSI